MKIGRAVRPGRRIEKKGKDRTVQDSLTKKSQSCNISPIWGEAPTVPIETEIRTERHLADVIMCAKFQDEIFRGYDFTGVEFPIFPIHFAWALQQQRYCAACDNSNSVRSRMCLLVVRHIEKMSLQATFESSVVNVAVLSSVGRLFQALGAAAENALSPILRLVWGTM